MINFINQIIEIDKDARVRVEKAHQDARAIIADAENEGKIIKAHYITDTKNKLTQVEEDYSRLADEKIIDIQNTEKQRISALEQIISQSKGKWEREIIENIIGFKLND